MEAFSLNYLIDDVNEVIKRPSAGELMLLVKSAVKDVFEQIGIELLAEPTCKRMEVKEGKIRLDKEVLFVHSVLGENEKDVNELAAPVFSNTKSLGYGFYQTPMELSVPHVKEPFVKVCYWKFYEDEQKNPLIPFLAYKACLKMAIASALTTVSADHPSRNERMIYEQGADKEIIIARGLLNKGTRARSLNRQRFF